VTTIVILAPARGLIHVAYITFVFYVAKFLDIFRIETFWIQKHPSHQAMDTIDGEFASEIYGDITLDELTAVVKSLKNNKAPGRDGLTNEFYKKFLEKIKHLLHTVIMESISLRVLPLSLMIGVITLLPKQKKLFYQGSSDYNYHLSSLLTPEASLMWPKLHLSFMSQNSSIFFE
jgi:hypothetical protein